MKNAQYKSAIKGCTQEIIIGIDHSPPHVILEINDIPDLGNNFH